MRPPRVRSLGRLALLASLLGVGVGLTATPAGAHALLERSDPPESARLPESPTMLTLSFTEPPEPSLSGIQVLDRTGSEVQQGQASVPADDPGSLRVRVPELEEGVYTVVWRVVSQVDGHPTAGTFAFGVRVSPLQVEGPEVAAPPAQPEPSVLEMIGRWGIFVGLGLLLGGAWVGALAFREPPRSVIRLCLVACAVAAVGIVLLAVAQRQGAGVPLGELVGTDIGRALVWRTVALLVGGGFVILALDPRRWRRPALVAAGVAAAAAMLIHVDAGHASAASSFKVGQVVAQWAHFAAVGVWLGGLAALLLGVRGEPSDAKAAAVRRFSAVAAFALGAVAVTGVIRAVNEVGAWGALVSTGYGLLVLAKAGLLLALAALGGVNRYRNVPASRRSLGGLRRVSKAELGLASGVLAAAAVLATLVPPASIPEVQAAPAAVTATGSDFATSVRVRLDVDPAIPGPNRFRVRVTDYDTGEPVEADSVRLRFAFAGGQETQESTLDLEPQGDGVYEGVGANLATTGPWEVTALVQRGADSVEAPLQVATLCETTDVPGPLDSTVHIVQNEGGSTVEGYILPGLGQDLELHFTFQIEQGTELKVEEAPTFTAWLEGEEPLTLEPRRLGTPGHFFASLDLPSGRWRFDASATGQGTSLSGCFVEKL